jgi:hypothetical protein
MFSGRSLVHVGLGLKTDSQSIKDITKSSNTMMDNQYKTLKSKHLDALERIDAKRFCKSDGSRHELSISGTFTSSGIHLQANSTSLLIFHDNVFKWIDSSNSSRTSKTDLSMFATQRMKGMEQKESRWFLKCLASFQGRKSLMDSTPLLKDWFSISRGRLFKKDGILTYPRSRRIESVLSAKR